MGVVQIQYQQARPTSIEADISDERIQDLLRHALQDQDDPRSRLRAVRTVSEANFLNVAPDLALVDAMREVLLIENNEGIRLQTLKALNSIHVGMPVGEDLKNDTHQYADYGKELSHSHGGLTTPNSE